MRTFANNLRARAEALGLAGAEVARRAGLTERRYGNYVTGRREPDLATLQRIALVLDVSIDDLLSASARSGVPDESNLRHRLSAAAAALTDDDLALLVVQAEAIVSFRGSPD